MCDSQEAYLLFIVVVGLSEETVGVAKIEKESALTDCINEKLAPQTAHADLEVRLEAPERNSDINVVYLKEMKSRGICQIKNSSMFYPS